MRILIVILALKLTVLKKIIIGNQTTDEPILSPEPETHFVPLDISVFMHV